MPTATCRNGHQRTPENTRPRPDGHVRCLDCARTNNIYAVKRYQATAKGMVTRVRQYAKERVSA